MSHMIFELILWMLLAFFIGCIIGYLARSLFGQNEAEATAPAPQQEAKVAPAPSPEVVKPPAAAEPEPIPVAAAMPVAAPMPAERPAVPAGPMPAVPAGRPERPKGIAQPRDGKADNLQRISGIGPKYERTLHGLGFYHFDQIAVWKMEQIDWIDDHLRFNGRIQREEWVVQARLLADGNEEEFLAKYGTGGIRNRSGESKSGTRTRRR